MNNFKTAADVIADCNNVFLFILCYLVFYSDDRVVGFSFFMFVGLAIMYALFTLFVRKFEIKKCASFAQYSQNVGPTSHSLPLSVNTGLRVQF